VQVERNTKKVYFFYYQDILSINCAAEFFCLHVVNVKVASDGFVAETHYISYFGGRLAGNDPDGKDYETVRDVFTR
jgi:hypothetical protein